MVMVVLAELDVHHSRSCTPTRRLALGSVRAVYGDDSEALIVLLAAVVAGFVADLYSDQFEGIHGLLDDLASEGRVAQPRVAYRLQRDRHGLDVSRHTLISTADGLDVRLDGHGPPLPQVLGAIYATDRIRKPDRPRALDVIRAGVACREPMGPRAVARFAAIASATFLGGHRGGDDRWAFDALELDPTGTLTNAAVQHRFRILVRAAHPDRGADATVAAGRIDDLARARRVLLGRLNAQGSEDVVST